MPDSPSSSTTPELSNPLTQRLESRYIKPVGLVNATEFRASAVKTPQAIVQRSALVEQLQTRYGVHSHEVADSELVLANPPSSENTVNTNTDNTLSTVANSIAAIKKEVREGTTFDGFPTRSNVVYPSDSSNFQEGGSKKEDNQEGFKAQSHSSITPATGGQFRVSRKVIPKISQMDANTTIQAKSDTSKAVNSSITQIDEMPLANAIKTELQPSQVQMQSVSSPAELIQRSPVNTSLPVVSEIPSHSSIIQRVVNNENVKDAEYFYFSEVSNLARVDNPARNVNNSSYNSGNAQPANISQDISYVADNANNNLSPENSPAVLPFNTVNRRNTNSVSESNSQVAPRVITHQLFPPNIPNTSFQESNSSIPQVDVAQVAEQVSRIIFRQLRVERERRGFGR